MRARFPEMLLAATIAAGAADFAFANRSWQPLVLGLLSTLLVVPWLLVVVPRESVPGAGAPRQRRWGPFALHAVNVALLVAFIFAKWSVYLDLRSRPELVGSYRTYTAAITLLLALGLVLRGGRGARLAALSADQPARLMAVSFGVTSVLGALLLSLPVSVRDVGRVSLLDAWFMSMSAVCVTGLTTVNVAETYTLTGQLILCVLMQVGGLGIMVLTAAVTLLAGQRLAVKSSAVLAEMVDAASLAELKATIRVIVGYTFAFEAIGAVLLYVQFRGLPDIDAGGDLPGALAGSGGAAWAAVFHSVSAFCNGSLSNFREGVVPMAARPGVCMTLAALIVLGGLGFPVLHEILVRVMARARKERPRRMTLNTRLALVTSALLLGGMAVAYFVLEAGASFRALSWGERLNAAVFQSACARTSGFNVVDVASMRPATLLLTCFAMFVGADPGSTAGGIKTTTLAVIFASYRAELRGRRPRLFDRTIPESVVRRATGVAFLSVAIVAAAVFLLTLTERHDALALFFETVSAFSTTGISTGITPTLTTAGKFVLIATMLVGRIGPLTAALALADRSRPPSYELPEERVMIG